MGVVIGVDPHKGSHTAVAIGRDEVRLAKVKVGDRIVRMARYAPYNPVAFVDPGHALVLGGVRDPDEDLFAGRASSTWAFIAEPVDDHTCRLVIRSRGSSLIARLQAPMQFVMQRKMMLGIKQRVETSPDARAGS